MCKVRSVIQKFNYNTYQFFLPPMLYSNFMVWEKWKVKSREGGKSQGRVVCGAGACLCGLPNFPSPWIYEFCESYFQFFMGRRRCGRAGLFEIQFAQEYWPAGCSRPKNYLDLCGTGSRSWLRLSLSSTAGGGIMKYWNTIKSFEFKCKSMTFPVPFIIGRPCWSARIPKSLFV